MKSKSYIDLLRNPRWQKVRLEKLEAAGWACEVCYDTDEMLSVHHKHYFKGRKPWEYEPHELVVLCQPCHEEDHREIDLRKDLLSRLPVDGPGSVSDLFSVGAGYAFDQSPQLLDDPAFSRVAENSPYQVAMGRFLSSLELGVRPKKNGLDFMSAALAEGAGNSFFDDLCALLKSHDVQCFGPSFEGLE